VAGNDTNLFNIAFRIAKAESNWNPNAKNKSSSASGLFQFIDGTFRAYCINKYRLADSMAQKNNPYIQIDCAVKMLNLGLVGHWDASASVWKKSL